MGSRKMIKNVILFTFLYNTHKWLFIYTDIIDSNNMRSSYNLDLAPSDFNNLGYFTGKEQHLYIYQRIPWLFTVVLLVWMLLPVFDMPLRAG